MTELGHQMLSDLGRWANDWIQWAFEWDTWALQWYCLYQHYKIKTKV